MNILILSCGTRSLLVDYFRNRENGFDKVVVTDCSVNSPALYRADKYYIVPRMKEPDYLPTLYEICKKEDINVVLPLQEDELGLISENSEEFRKRDVLPVVSTTGVVNLCRDKYAFYNKMCEIGVPSVPTYLAEDKQEAINNYGFPLFMKPRYGAGSVDSIKINVDCAITGIIENEDEKFIIQPYIDGTEYGVNFYVDFITGKLTELFVMEKIRMRAGETEKSMSVHDEKIRNIVDKICKNVPFRGPVDMDVIKKDDMYYVLEVNPRFGGGYPHTHSCGINFIKLISNNARGYANDYDISDYEDEIVAFRYGTISLMRKEDMPNEK